MRLLSRQIKSSVLFLNDDSMYRSHVESLYQLIPPFDKLRLLVLSGTNEGNCIVVE